MHDERERFNRGEVVPDSRLDCLCQFVLQMVEMQKALLRQWEAVAAQLQVRQGGALGACTPTTPVVVSRRYAPLASDGRTEALQAGKECTPAGGNPVIKEMPVQERIVQAYEAFCFENEKRAASIRSSGVFEKYLSEQVPSAKVREVFKSSDTPRPYELYPRENDVRSPARYWLVECEGAQVVLPAPNSPDEFNDLVIFDLYPGGPYKPRDYLTIIPPKLGVLPNGAWSILDNGKIGRAEGPRPVVQAVAISIGAKECGGSVAPAPLQNESLSMGGSDGGTVRMPPTQGVSESGVHTFCADVGRAFVVFCRSVGGEMDQEYLCNQLRQNLSAYVRDVDVAVVNFNDGLKGFTVTDAFGNVVVCPSPNSNGTFDPKWDEYITGCSSVNIRTIRHFKPYCDNPLSRGSMSPHDTEPVGNGSGADGRTVRSESEQLSQRISDAIIRVYPKVLLCDPADARPEKFSALLRAYMTEDRIRVRGLQRSEVRKELFVESLRPGLAGSVEHVWLVEYGELKTGWLVPACKHGKPVEDDAFRKSHSTGENDGFRLISPARVERDYSVVCNKVAWRMQINGKGEVSQGETNFVKRQLGKLRRH